jgi:hypothetical protein
MVKVFACFVLVVGGAALLLLGTVTGITQDKLVLPLVEMVAGALCAWGGFELSRWSND